MKPSVLAGCAVLVLGCENLVCTQIGCYDGLVVTVPSAASSPFRVEAYVLSGARYAFTCGGAPCVAQFPDFTPAFVRIDVIAGADTVTREFNPRYVLSRPNGSGCDPECRIATVTFVP